jgi:hypothetical protein
MAWNLFMDEQFNDLRRTLRSTDEEMRRFRQLVVRGRWGKAFQETPKV